jgi:hypothetical protein
MAEAEKGSMAKHILWTALPVLASALVAPPARLVDSSGRVREADDLGAISAQQLELYARCE